MMSCCAERMALSKKEENLFEPALSGDLHQKRMQAPGIQTLEWNPGLMAQVDPKMYRLSVTGLVKKALHLSLEDIFEAFPKVSTTAPFHYAGRDARHGYRIHTARWAGVRLRHILLASGIEPEAQVVEFLELGNQAINK